MRRLRWLAVATAALTVSAVALGAASAKNLTVTGNVQAVSKASITVNGTTCVFAPTNSRMMMPTIIRDVSAGDDVTMTCTRAAGRLVVTKIIEKPSGAVITRGAVTNVTSTSITVRGVTCTFSATSPPNPRMGMPTFLRGDLSLMACLRANGQTVLSAATELTPHPGGVVLVSGNVSAVGSGSITVNGITCLVLRTAKPVPGMPTILKSIEPGDSAVMTCTHVSGHLVATGVESH